MKWRHDEKLRPRTATLPDLGDFFCAQTNALNGAAARLPPIGSIEIIENCAQTPQWPMCL
jgi:hypothetical protein